MPTLPPPIAPEIPAETSLRQFCQIVTDELADAGPRFGEIYVHRAIELYRRYKRPELKIGLFSSTHGPDFFVIVLRCLDGEPWKEEGEYGENFRRFIRRYREIETGPA